MSTARLRVLLVAEPSGARLLRGLLAERPSLEVTGAAGVDEAVSLLGSDELDAVLLELPLPGTDGVEAVEKLRAAAGTVPIVVLTAEDAEGLGREALDRGALDHLPRERATADALLRSILYAVERGRREAAEAALQRGAEHFRALIEHGTDTITILDRDGTIRYESPSLQRMLGWRPEELVGRNVFDFIHPDHHTQVGAELRALLERADRVVAQVPFLHKDGSWRVLEATGSNLLENAAVGGIVVNTRDVTARIRAEERERELIGEQSARAAAEAAAHQLEEVLESITDAFFAFDPGWHIRYANSKAVTLMGRPRTEVIGRTPWDLYPYLLDQPVFAGLQRVMEERVSIEFDYPSTANPGVWLRLHASPTTDGAVVYVRDVTRRKEAEERSRFQAHLLDTVGEAVIATDPDGTIRYWNHAAEQLYGWAANEVLGLSVVEVVSGRQSQEQAAEIVRNLRAGQPWSGEFNVCTRDGREFPAWVSDTPVLGGDGSLEAIIGVSFDVTERRAGEDALHDERRRLAEAQRVAKLGSWEWDVATGAVNWSDEMYRIYGYEPHAFTPTLHSAMAAVHPDEAAQVAERTEHVLRSQAPFEYDNRIVRPDGEVRFIRGRGVVKTDEEGAPVRVIGTVQDITERHLQEEHLARMKAALDATMDGICIVSREGVFEYVNQAKASTFGCRGPEEMVGRRWREFYPAAEVERIEEEILPGFELTGRWRGEVTARRTDGSTFPAMASMTRIDEDRWVQVDWDLTEQRRAQDELRRRGEMVRLLQMAATAANESATLEQALHVVVEQVCRFTHLDAGHAYLADPGTGELAPTNIWCTADPGRFAVFQRATREARFAAGDGLPGRALAAGGPVWVEDLAADARFSRQAAAEAADLHAGVAFPVLAGADVVAVLEFFSTRLLPPDALLQDTLGNVGTQLGRVAERTRAEAELRAAREEAERANRAKSEFLSRMSHELRTPLNAILGFGQLLEVDVEREEDRESVELILRAGRHLLALIDEVLDLSRIEAGEMSLSVEPVSVREAAYQSLDLVRHMATERGIEIVVPGDLAPERRVRADLQRLKQVLLNLLSNAIKYNRAGGTVSVTYEEAADAKLRIVVSDTGYGIPEEKLRRLFVPFDRLDAERTAVEGTGLGLALSRGLMHAMGGTLGVESREGVGSRFWVELPLAEEEAPDAPRRRADPAPEPESGTTHTVLVIEDNLANVRLMERIFRRRPHVRLLVAMQGSMGLELARQHRPGLILLDLNLPGISGREVLRELRSDPALRHVPVVMVSGDAMPEKVERLKEEGAHGYITKPFNVNEVLRLVDETLDGAGEP